MSSSESKFRDEEAVALDYETFYDPEKGYSLPDMGNVRYCADRRFDPYLVAICGKGIWDTDRCRPTRSTRYTTLDDGRQLYVGRPEDFGCWELLNGRMLIAHNAGFDSTVTAECVKRGIVRGLDLSTVEWSCTADLTAYLGVERSLKSAMYWLFGKTISKVVRDSMRGRHVCDLDEEELRELYDYGGGDAVECHDIWLKYAKDWPEVERRISRQNMRAVAHGAYIDRPYAEAALKELESYNARVMADIPWTAEINPNNGEFYAAGSPIALKREVERLGLVPPKTFAKNKVPFIEWMQNPVARYDEAVRRGYETVGKPFDAGYVEKVTDPKTGKKVEVKRTVKAVHVKPTGALSFISARQKSVSLSMQMARVKKIVESIDADGASHSAFKYFGAHTGRFSGKDANQQKGDKSGNVNMLNMPRKPVLVGDPNVFGGKGVDIRGMYIPRPGHKFAIYDFAQIEARYSLWLVDDHHMMEALRREKNLYQANSVAMGWSAPGDKIKETDPEKYLLAKKCVLGLGYGMGAARFVESCKEEGLILPVLPRDQWDMITVRTKSRYDRSSGEFLEILEPVKLLESATFALRQSARIRDPLAPENEEAVGRFLYAQKTINEWRKANQRIVAQWQYYQDVFVDRCVRGKTTCAFALKSGRVKRYFDPKFESKPTVEIDADGKEVQTTRPSMKACYVRGEEAKWLTKGSIMENIVQASCRDIMTYGCLEIEEKHPNWKFVFSVYDEVIFEVPDEECDEAKTEIPRILCHGDRVAPWTEGLMLEVEGGIETRYCK